MPHTLSRTSPAKLAKFAQRALFDDENLNLVDGWWSFRRSWGGASRLEPEKSLQIARAVDAGTLTVLVKVLSGSEKWPLSRDFQADARTRTGDPFIYE
jgi:hypothetical protein